MKCWNSAHMKCRITLNRNNSFSYHEMNSEEFFRYADWKFPRALGICQILVNCLPCYNIQGISDNSFACKVLTELVLANAARH